MSDSKLEFTFEIPLRTVIGCAQLLVRQSQDPRSVVQGELILSTLNSMIGWFEKQGWIDHVPVEDLNQAYFELFGIHPPGYEPPQADFRIESLASALDSALAQHETEKQLAVSNRSTEPTPTPDIPEPISIDLSKINRMGMDMLAKLAPKDVLIEKCMKGIVDPAYKWAVEIVYTSLSPELWGTKTAEQAVNDMLARHKGE